MLCQAASISAKVEATLVSIHRQGRATPEVSVFGARRLPIPAARGPLNLLRA